MRRNYRASIANETSIGACNICDEVRCRSWRVSLNNLLERIPGYCVLEFYGIDSGKHVVNSYLFTCGK